MNLIILQVDAGLYLVLGLIMLMFLAWLFWPKKGGLALILRMKQNNQRVLLEDALKFLFDCEYKNTYCDIHSLAGNVGISLDKAGKLIERLLTLDLITLKDQYIHLTDSGRSYALRVIRIHRIWERYLADETSMNQADWHNEACRIEHYVTAEETEKLAAQMGNPVFDPHGDPIPTIHGELPKQSGVALNNFKEGEMGYIVHIEDEPRSIYEQLMVEGLYLGMQVYVTDVAENKITFVADGDECSLTPLFASYITVEKSPEKEPRVSKHDLLASLEMGEMAEVTGISPNCRGQQRRRLMDLGIVPGSQITAVMQSASGDPKGYRVMGTTIGIRKNQAEQVFINRKNKE